MQNLRKRLQLGRAGTQGRTQILTSPIKLSEDGAVAVIRIDNPPGNALGHGVRAALAEALEKARGDVGVEAIVVGGTSGVFSGGADITAFGQPMGLLLAERGWQIAQE
jgi:enoyl-CoA hydratase/carnithine racemase